ncbi:hypothetical protein ACYATP_08000 [Lactobacillaceae bacterium Melli_B4]
MDAKKHAKLMQILNPDFDKMDSLMASRSINHVLELINALEWQSDQVDQNVYDALNDQYSDRNTINERLKLLANTFDHDDFLLSIIDQLRDRVNDSGPAEQLYAITLDHDSKPLTDDEIQNLEANHSITLRAVTNQDAYNIIQRFKELLTQAKIKY